MALDNGADVNKAGKSGALVYRRKEFSFLFCQVLNNYKIVIKNGDPERHLDIVQLLINSGPDLNNFDDYQKTALMLGMFLYQH